MFRDVHAAGKEGFMIFSSLYLICLLTLPGSKSVLVILEEEGQKYTSHQDFLLDNVERPHSAGGDHRLFSHGAHFWIL